MIDDSQKMFLAKYLKTSDSRKLDLAKYDFFDLAKINVSKVIQARVDF